MKTMIAMQVIFMFTMMCFGRTIEENIKIDQDRYAYEKMGDRIKNLCFDSPRNRSNEIAIMTIIKGIDKTNQGWFCASGLKMVNATRMLCSNERYIQNTNVFSTICYRATNDVVATIPIYYPSSEQKRDVLMNITRDGISHSEAPFKGHQNDIRFYDLKQVPYVEPVGYNGQTFGK